MSLSTQELKRVPAKEGAWRISKEEGRGSNYLLGIGKERRKKVSEEKSQTSCHYMPQKQGEAPTGWPAASPFTP